MQPGQRLPQCCSGRPPGSSRLPAWAIVVAALLLATQVDGAATIFSIIFTPAGDASLPTPEEYFNDMQIALAAEGEDSILASGLFDAESLLARVDKEQDFSNGVVTLQVCDLEPLWEKGEIVYDLKDCPFSTVKLVVYALVPAVTMSCGLLGVWSRQRNVRGRGKDTQIASLMALGLSILSVSYDWFFSWTLFRSPRGDFQGRFSVFGLAHLISIAALNFLLVHFWLRRKYLVGMPWYEYHKHGLALHLVFLIMYVQPQSVVLFQSRLFDVDVFNIHFGTPSKMNEVLSNVGCLSILSDIPQLALQAAVWIADETGMQAPKVSRVSMALSVLSVAFVVKRQYIATVERQWYKEVVRMAGVRRLTTYGGASRWLKFQKRASAAGDVKSQSSTQQQLFLAWMQSMGRRQDSIFQDAATTQKALEEDADNASLDSEDEIDTLSDESLDNAEGESIGEGEHDDPEGEGSELGAGSQHSEDLDQDEHSQGDEGSLASGSGSGSGLSGEDDDEEASDGSEGSVKLQAYRRRGRRATRHRASREESPLGRRRFSGEGRGDGVSSIVSESDIMAFARGVAGRASESGLASESYGDLSEAAEGEASGGGSLLRFARAVARDEASSALGGGGAGAGDLLGFAREVARGASMSASGVDESRGGESDLFALARRAAQGISESGAPSESDVFAFAQQAARGVSESGVGGSAASGGSDIYAFARRMAEDVSHTGVGANSAVSGATESDIFAFAKNVADHVSHSGVGSAAPSAPPRPAPPARPPAPPARPPAPPGPRESRRAPRAPGGEASDLGSVVESDIFAAAARAAAEVSMSGVGAPSQAGTAASEDLFAAAQRAAADASVAGSQAETAVSSIFGAARRAAADVSASGVGSASVAGAGLGGLGGVVAKRARPRVGLEEEEPELPRQRRGRAPEPPAPAAPAPELPALASRPASGPMSEAESGEVESGEDVFAAARQAAQEASAPSEVDTAVSSIFGAARRAAAEISASGVGTELPGPGGLAAAGAALAGRPRPRPWRDEEAEERPRRRRGRGPGAAWEAEGSPDAEASSGAGSDDGDDGLGGIFAQGPLPEAAPASAWRSRRGQEAMAPAAEAPRPEAQASAWRTSRGDSEALALAREAAAKVQPQDLAGGARAAAADQRSVVSSAGASVDLFQLARGVADDVSRSGVQSASVAGASLPAGLADFFAPTRGEPPAPPAPARAAAPRSEVSAAGSAVSGLDLFALARGTADEVSRSGVQSSAAASAAVGGMADLFANVQRVAVAEPGDEDAESQVSDGDLFAVARGAAGELSRSGAGSASVAGSQGLQDGLADLFTSQQRSARSAWGRGTASTERPQSTASAWRQQQAPTGGDANSRVGASSEISGGDLFAVARGIAEHLSTSGVESASAAGGRGQGQLADLFGSARRAPARRAAAEEDADHSDVSGESIFAAARGAAQEASRSGVQSAAGGQALGSLGDLFSGRRRQGGAPSRSGSDLLGSARRAADEFSQSGLGDGSDILGTARRAAEELSQSGVESDIFDAARRAADELSQSAAGSGSDILGAARRAAGELSRSGVGAQSSAWAGQTLAGLAVPRGKAGGRKRDLEFKPPQRRFAAEGRHARAPPAGPGAAGRDPDPPPWAALDAPAEGQEAARRCQHSPPVDPAHSALVPDLALLPRVLPRPPRRPPAPAPPSVAAPPLPADVDALARLKQRILAGGSSSSSSMAPQPPPPLPRRPPHERRKGSSNSAAPAGSAGVPLQAPQPSPSPPRPPPHDRRKGSSSTVAPAGSAGVPSQAPPLPSQPPRPPLRERRKGGSRATAPLAEVGAAQQAAGAPVSPPVEAPQDGGIHLPVPLLEVPPLLEAVGAPVASLYEAPQNGTIHSPALPHEALAHPTTPLGLPASPSEWIASPVLQFAREVAAAAAVASGSPLSSLRFGAPPGTPLTRGDAAANEEDVGLSEIFFRRPEAAAAPPRFGPAAADAAGGGERPGLAAVSAAAHAAALAAPPPELPGPPPPQQQPVHPVQGPLSPPQRLAALRAQPGGDPDVRQQRPGTRSRLLQDEGRSYKRKHTRSAVDQDDPPASSVFHGLGPARGQLGVWPSELESGEEPEDQTPALLQGALPWPSAAGAGWDGESEGELPAGEAEEGEWMSVTEEDPPLLPDEGAPDIYRHM